MAMMMDVVDQVRDYLDKNDWRYEYEDDRKIIRAGVNLKCKLQSVRLLMHFNEGGYTVVAVPAMKADKECIVNVMEFITRANYGLRNGNFELDMNDGEIRYKVYTNYKGLPALSDEVIEDSIMFPALMFERYGDGMAALMFGFSDPATEIAKIENH